jgi:ABC-type multidrug transport system permease subunit
MTHPALRYHPLVNLTLARMREFLREPEAVFWVYVFPLILVVALGVAFRNRPVEAIRVVVQSGEAADSVLAALKRDPRFQAIVCDEQEGRRQLRTGRADLMIAASAGAQTSEVSKTSEVYGDPAGPWRYEYAFDPTRTESVLARNAADDFLQRAAGRRDAAEVRDRQLDEPGARYIDFLVPGLLGMGLMGGGLWGVGFAIVDMRIRKLLKRYVATPMKRVHFLGAVIISRLLFTATEVLILIVFARLIFGVVNLGSYLAVGLLILLGSLEFAGIGLLVASRAQTIESVSGLMNLVMLPMWIASGIFFSTERFPDAIQPVLAFLPLNPLIHALRTIMLEGTSLWSLGGDIALIAAWGGVCFVLGLRWFRWN